MCFESRALKNVVWGHCVFKEESSILCLMFLSFLLSIV